LQYASLFYSLLKKLDKKRVQCRNCGVIGVDLCKDEEACDKRKFFVEELLKKYPYKELNVLREDFWKIFFSRESTEKKGLKHRRVMFLSLFEYKKLINLKG
jgi:hypothetical protein